MAMRLAYRTLLHPRDMATVWRVLAAYRRAQETLRGVCPDCSNIAEEQIRIACRSTGVSQAAVACHVAEWIENAPLDLLSSAMYDGLREALRTAKQNGLKLAVWSDYPAVAKLEAMGVASFFNVVVSAHDSEVQRFKPDPRGLEVVLRRLGVSRDQAIYIGDRPEVDGQAAAHIGIKCFIIGKRATCGPEPPHWNYLADYGELNQFIRAASQQDSSVRP
jgi:FMN phosphatase YigB (HAD superfamily)